MHVPDRAVDNQKDYVMEFWFHGAIKSALTHMTMKTRTAFGHGVAAKSRAPGLDL